MTSQKGNVLFIILIAVALFAALTYAVTSTTRVTSNAAENKEAGDADAAVILLYASTIKVEVDKLRTVYGLDYNQIDFYNNFSHFTSSGAMGALKQKNPNCTAIQAQKPCAVFMENGGSVQSRDFYNYSRMIQFVTSGHPVPGEAQFFSQFIENIGSEAPEIVMYIVDLKKSVCDAINRRLQLPLADTQPLVGWNVIGERNYWIDATDYSLRAPSTASAYIGQPTFCFRQQSFQYVFIHTLIPR